MLDNVSSGLFAKLALDVTDHLVLCNDEADCARFF